MKITHTPPSDSWLAVLEEVHPESIRWDVESKKQCIYKNDLCFWVVDSENDSLYLGEFLIDRDLETGHYAHLISISSLKKGAGNFMWEYLMTLLPSVGVDTIIGEARPGASWHLAQKHGAKKIGDIVNHGGTGETYIDFIIELK
jgi:hypothetical protein